MRFRLRFPTTDIPKWAARYDEAQDEGLGGPIRESVNRRGYLERDEFLAVCRWKTPRSQPRCAGNDADEIRAATGLALATTTPPRLKIDVLRLLAGVGWPTASVILHFFDRAPFPILDYRALWSVGQETPPPPTYDFWHAYTRFTRELAERAGCDMRALDRALWQYSKEKQPGSSRG